jgi:hypothetical protein
MRHSLPALLVGRVHGASSIGRAADPEIKKISLERLALFVLATLAIGLARVSSAQTVSQKMAADIMSAETLNFQSGDDDDLNLPSFLETDQDRHGKSKFLALGLSLLLPGAGQYYAENKTKTIIFGSAEASIWGSYFGIRQYGKWKKDDYRAWAAFHAGADVNDKPDIFFEKLTYYDNIDEYSQLAPLYDGDEAILFPATSDYYWNWDSENNRDRYRELRNQSKNAYRRSLFLVGAAIINRLLSGIDAFRTADYYESDSEFGQAGLSAGGAANKNRAGWNLYYNTSGPLWNSEVEIGFARKF